MIRIFTTWTCLLIAATMMMVTPAHASRVSPMSVDIEPYGRASIARVRFVNTSSREFPVEARAFRGIISEEGELELVPADDDFIIFPPQLVVKPQGEQVFRLQYVGEPELAQAEVYYLSIRQLPIELEPGDPKIQVLVNFNVFVNLQPDDVSSEPRIDTVVEATQEDVEGVRVRLANDGDGMLLAGTFGWDISGQNDDGTEFKQTLNPTELGGIIGVGVVAPGKARQFFLPIEETVDRSTLKIELK